MKPAKIKKLVITAAGKGTRLLPLTAFQSKESMPILNIPAVYYLINEAIDAGIEEIFIVINSLKNSITKYFTDLDEVIKTLTKHKRLFEADLLSKIKKVKVRFVVQKKHKGIGAALLAAKTYLKNKPFALMLGDEVFLDDKPQIANCINSFLTTGKSTIGLVEVSNEEANKYGIVSVDENNDVVAIEEKPSSVESSNPLAICGRYVFTPYIFSFLKPLNDVVCLTKAMNAMSKVEKITTTKLNANNRCDLGSLNGILKANQIACLRFKK